jgi:hypothetical protein
MKIFRTIIATEEIGEFLADAVHDGGKVSNLTVYPVSDGLVGSPLGYDMEDLPDIVREIESVLQDI